MLTLTRRAGERITIGANIEVTVLDVSGGKVKIGISAPRELPVYRGELVDRIEAENKRAMARTTVTNAPDEHTIAFPGGLFGMGENRRFVLCEIDDGHPCRVLVSRADSSVQLLVADVAEHFPDYPIEAALKAAGASPEDAAVAVIVRAPADGSQATANLIAPVVISTSSREGVQIILEDPMLSTAVPFTAPIPKR